MKKYVILMIMLLVITGCNKKVENKEVDKSNITTTSEVTSIPEESTTTIPMTSVITTEPTTITTTTGTTNNNKTTKTTKKTTTTSKKTTTTTKKITTTNKKCIRDNLHPERIMYMEIPCGASNPKDYEKKLADILNKSMNATSGPLYEDMDLCMKTYRKGCGYQFSWGYIYSTDYEQIGLYVKYDMYASEGGGTLSVHAGEGYLNPDNTIVFSWKNY